MKQISFFITAYILTCININAQYRPSDDVYPDAVFEGNIKTSRIFKEGWEMSYPIYHFNDETPLIVTFDEISKNARYYSYSIIHCDADWRQSRFATSEYMTGFPTNRIKKYEYSFNTVMPYVHYRLTIPNEDVQLKVSGNYAVVVYEDGYENRPVLCRRFSVVEPYTVVSAHAGPARQTARQNEWQQVDFTVRTVNYNIENAYNDVKVAVLQNGIWNTARTNVKPLFVRQNELDYRFIDQTLQFLAGNEYRIIDLKSKQYSSTRMAAIEFAPPTWHFFPYLDLSRATSRYVYYEDWNGKYSIQAERTSNPDTEADYVYVHFVLTAAQPFPDAQVYVTGEFCNNGYSIENLMRYNSEERQYEARILLKQGYYNYRYSLLSSKSITDDYQLEGNFYDTENDYVIYIYHRGRSSRYDRLIGVSIVNALKD